MDVCLIEKYFANAFLLLLGTSIVYMSITGCMGDTPFADSLSPDQKVIKEKSRNTRLKVTAASAVFTSVLMLLYRF